MITISAFADEIGPDLDLQMDVCESQGVRWIDVRGIDNKNVSKMTPADTRQYRRRMKDRGFSAACIGSPIGKIRMDEDFDAHMELLKNCFAVADAFETRLIRVFSFYPSKGKAIADERNAVMDRLAEMVRSAEKAGMILLHENEKNIYGAAPDGVKDIFNTIRSEHLKCVFDPANFVEENVAPYDGAWTKGLGDLTFYFHIKDKRRGEDTCIPAGEGEAQIEPIFNDLRKRLWSGFMALEPHMKAAGKFSGFTGPELFAQAAQALKNLCQKTGLKVQ